MKETLVNSSEIEVKIKSPKRPTYRRVISAIFYVLLSIVIIFSSLSIFVNNYYTAVWVDGTSMMPNLENFELGLMDSHTDKIAKISRFDIVIAYVDINQNGIDDDYPVIKRVIGLPGETVQIFDGGNDSENNELPDYIEVSNGDNTYQLDENFNNPYASSTYRSGANYAISSPLILNDDEFFLLGDNRGVSIDSRSFGAVQQSEIIGVLIWVYGRAKQISTVQGSNNEVVTNYDGRQMYWPWEIRYYG
ncbi:MAG: signal peptidase I [Bacilli bacterium]|jgi:signal peptidase I|nr:signal peptidase I [Bacilli bacterium]